MAAPDVKRRPVGSGTAQVATGQEATPSLLHAAVGYATLGWPVFPCRPGAKEPIGAAVPHGCLDATTDIGTITRWWRRWPHANVAVATGAPGPDVLDVDVKNGAPGLQLFERVKAAGLVRGAAAIIATPSGGMHLWFNGTSQSGGAVRRRALELKATGGYVLVPPSRTAAGVYRVVDQRPGGGFIDWAAIVRLLDPPAAPAPYRRSAGNGAGLADWLSRQTTGNRAQGLVWAVKKRVDGGGTDLADLEEAARSTGLPEQEITRIVAWGHRRMRGTG